MKTLKTQYEFKENEEEIQNLKTQDYTEFVAIPRSVIQLFDYTSVQELFEPFEKKSILYDLF